MSMKDIGIMDGDLLAVHKTQEARNGQVIVARIDDEVTVKRLKKQGNTVQLLPENSDFDPIVVDLRYILVPSGRVVKLLIQGDYQRYSLRVSQSTTSFTRMYRLFPPPFNLTRFLLH